jgi:mono/diheme cytochrome c family protein
MRTLFTTLAVVLLAGAAVLGLSAGTRAQERPPAVQALGQAPPAAPAVGPLFANGLLPPVLEPAENPQTDEKVRLGAQLYFDTRLSSDNSISCASCHSPDHGWADPSPTSAGVHGARGTRNSPTVLNAAYHRFQFWDGRARSLEDQSLGPIQNPVEMGMTMPMALTRIKGIPGYVAQFQRVFAQEPTNENVAWAISAFERTVVSTDSPYDRFLLGDQSAMSHSITLHRPMRIDRPEPDVYAVDGTPTDCVVAGMHGLLKEPLDLIVSGINLGANMGDDVFYSGTVAAAIEGAIQGLPAIALSLVTSGRADFT